MTIYGYARVSTDGQSVAAQDAALREAGAAKVYSEKVSGVVTDRKALARALKALVLLSHISANSLRLWIW